MNIEILHMVEGAKKAHGIAVIIDVFRAFSVEAYIMSNGCKKLIPVGDMQIAYDYKNKDENVILIGERKGVKLPGFDYGNSPTQIHGVDFRDKVIVHTTSSGTQGIANANNADEVLTGSLVNANAIAKYIKEKNPENVSLVCMGLNNASRIEEDTLCAEYIKSLLEDNPIDLKEPIEQLKSTSGAKFFNKELNEVFPQNDFYYCTDVNKFNFVLRVVKGKEDLDYIERIDV